MASIVDTIIDEYNYVFHELADPRTQNWWAVSNPFIILSIVSSYLYFCKSLGPRLMKNRKPFELKNVLLIYNSFQVLLSLFIVYLGSKNIFSKEYNLACMGIDYSESPIALTYAADCWWYYFAKITELLDTVFFVLRKKDNQLSLLHIYHHTCMSFFIWLGVKYFAGGHVYFMGYLNSIVHVIMYTYYLISGLGPEYQKYVWWKKHVTVIQLIQFCMIFVHNFIVLFNDCSYPKMLNLLVCCNSGLFIYMFGKFYIQSYNKESARKDKLAKDGSVMTDNKQNGYCSGSSENEKAR